MLVKVPSSTNYHQFIYLRDLNICALLSDTSYFPAMNDVFNLVRDILGRDRVHNCPYTVMWCITINIDKCVFDLGSINFRQLDNGSTKGANSTFRSTATEWVLQISCNSFRQHWSFGGHDLLAWDSISRWGHASAATLRSEQCWCIYWPLNGRIDLKYVDILK